MDSFVERGWGGQLDEHDVIVQGVGAVARVADHFSRVDQLLRGFGGFQVVFPELHLDATGKQKAQRVLYCYGRLRETPCHRVHLVQHHCHRSLLGQGIFLVLQGALGIHTEILTHSKHGW